MDKSVVLREPSQILPAIEGTGLEGLPKDAIQQIYDMLASGWLPYRISAYLFQRRGFDIDPQSIDKFFIRIPEDNLLPATALKRHLRHANFVVDPLEEMRRILRVIEERVSRELELEENAGAKELSPRVDMQMERYWQKLKEYHALEKDPTPGTQEPEGETSITFREIFLKFSKDKQEKAGVSHVVEG